jgi:hypothetical protein
MARLYRHPTDPPAASEHDVRRVVVSGGDLLDPAHQLWTGVDAIAWGPQRYRTRFRAVWVAEALVARFDCDDDEPWWTITERDGRLWEEEVVEIFLDPAGRGSGYAEVEINPANVACDLRVDSPWPSLSSDPQWNWAGLVSRVDLSRSPDGARCVWSVVILLPFEGLASLSEATARRLPPVPGDRWRFNVFRIKRPGGAANPARDAIFAAWSVPDGPSFHAPHVFRDLVFVS